MKQRLVGILVFSCLLLLAWHLVFSNEGPRPVDTRSQIPPAPEVKPIEVQSPKKPVFATRPAPSVSPSSSPEVNNSARENTADNKAAESAPLASAGSSSSTSATSKEPQSRPKPTTAPARDESTGLPMAWGVQLTALADKSVAKALVNDLKADGYQAFLRELKRSSGMLYRVIIGPKINKDDAERLRLEVEKRYQRFQPMIVRFER